MAETPDQRTPDLMQLWRDWLTTSERQLNAFLSETLDQETSARSMAGFVEMYAAFQRMLAEVMQRYLAFINMPSRTDVIGLGEMLRSIEDRLLRIEETLQIAAEAIDAHERAATPAHEPARTRQLPVFPSVEEVRAEVPVFAREPRVEEPTRPEEAGAEVSPIPEELRR